MQKLLIFFLVVSILLNIGLILMLFLSKTAKETSYEEEENKRLAQEAKELEKTFKN
jgi:hypothetical protein